MSPLIGSVILLLCVAGGKYGPSHISLWCLMLYLIINLEVGDISS